MGGKPRPCTDKRLASPGNFNIYSTRMADNLAKHRAKTENITYVLVGRPYQGLKALRAECSFASDHELVSQALELIAYLAEKKKDGCTLQLVTPSGAATPIAWSRVVGKKSR